MLLSKTLKHIIVHNTGYGVKISTESILQVYRPPTQLAIVICVGTEQITMANYKGLYFVNLYDNNFVEKMLHIIKNVL